MLNKLQIFTEVKYLLIKSDLVFITKGQVISPASDLYNYLGMDSLDACEFLMMIEKHFDISIPDDDAVKVSTLSDVCACVQKELIKKQEKQEEQQKTTNKLKNTLFKHIFTKTR